MGARGEQKEKEDGDDRVSTVEFDERAWKNQGFPYVILAANCCLLVGLFGAENIVLDAER